MTRNWRAVVVVFLLVVGCERRDERSVEHVEVSASDKVPAGVVPVREGRLVDLTHAFDEQTIYWPTEAGFVLERGQNGVTEKGYYYAANRFRSAEHGGTHIDAPIHFFDRRHTVDEIPLERLVGEAAVIDVSEK